MFKGTGFQSYCPDVCLSFVLTQFACSFGHEIFLAQNFNFSSAL